MGSNGSYLSLAPLAERELSAQAAPRAGGRRLWRAVLAQLGGLPRAELLHPERQHVRIRARTLHLKFTGLTL